MARVLRRNPLVTLPRWAALAGQNGQNGFLSLIPPMGGGGGGGAPGGPGAAVVAVVYVGIDGDGCWHEWQFDRPVTWDGVNPIGDLVVDGHQPREDIMPQQLTADSIRVVYAYPFPGAGYPWTINNPVDGVLQPVAWPQSGETWS